MSKRDWLHRVASAGLLVACSVVASHAQGHRESQPETPQSQQNEPQSNPSPPSPITITGPIRVEREKEPQPDWNKLNCGEAKSHEEADLCEQRRMAKAAENAVTINWLQVVLGIFGFFALLISLALNRRATNAATVAAETAEKVMFDVEAPFLYPAIISTTARQDFAPFLINDNPRSRPGLVQPLIRFKIVNHGRGPAIFRSYRAVATCVDDVDAVGPLIGESRSIENSIIESQTKAGGHSGFWELRVAPPLDAAAVSDVLAGIRYVVFRGEFRFSGVHGADYVQTFGLVLNIHRKSYPFFPLGPAHNKRTRYQEGTQTSPKWWKIWKTQP